MIMNKDEAKQMIIRGIDTSSRICTTLPKREKDHLLRRTDFSLGA